MKRALNTSIKTTTLTFIFLLFSSVFSFGQVDIVVNSFEETAADTWTIQSLTTPECTNGGDRWDYSTTLSSITPSDGSQFWGIQDLNGNCGGASYESITFATVDVSSYTSVTVSFEYYTIGFESADDLGYEIWEDGVKVVDDVSLGDDTRAWTPVSYNVTASVTNVYLVLKAKQNGGSDYGAFDNVKLRGISGSLPPCTEPSQATSLVFSNVTSSSIDVAFTASGADNYLVVQSTSSSLSATPSDASTYAVSDALGGGTVVYNGSGTSFIDGSLTSSTTYYYFVFAYNNTACSGGADYNITSLNGNETTIADPCAALKTIPYTQNFDAVDCWTVTGAWEIGTLSGDADAPATGNSGNTVAGTDLDADYATNQDIYLTSPTFDLTGGTNPELSFWMDMESESDWDGGTVQLSLNGGAWTTVEMTDAGYGGSVPNDTDVDGLANSEDGWSGDVPAGEWTEVTLDLFNLTTTGLVGITATDELQVRFWFGSDGSTNDNGWYIDDFIIQNVVPTPTVTVSPSLLTGFTYVEGSGPSAEQTFTVEGSNLTNDITITPPTNWEVSLSSGGPFQTTAITLSETSGSVANTTIYARMVSGLTNAASPFSGNIACESTGATTQNVAVDGTVTSSSLPTYCAEVDFTGSGNSGSYSTNTWTDAGIDWQATDSRGDQDLNGLEAVTLRSGSLTNTTSVGGGVGTLSFDYARVFSGNSTLKVFVNGSQYGGDISVTNTTSTNFSVPVNVAGNVDVELRNTGNRTVINNLKWTCGTPAPELSLELPTSSAISCGDTYDFGIQTTSTNTNQTLTITNTGSIDLDISSFPLTGTNASEFSISPASTSTTIAAGGTYDIVVTFSPTTAGVKSAEITINSNDDDEGACVINIAGEGILPCATPTAQPTALDLSTNTTTTSIDGTFTAASPVADSYLVVYSTNSTLSANPTDGVTYAADDLLGGGTVLGNITGTSFTASSLTEGTEYYFFIFSNNHSNCSGGPLYYTSSPLSGSEITTPDNVNWTDPDCISNSTIQLNWDAASGNSTGYLLVVREGASPHSINSLDPNTQVFNTDFSSAPQFGSTTEYSRVVYKGTATSITITNLPSADCVFKMYTYTIGSSNHVYSSGTQTTQTISLDDVISAGAVCGDSESSISWSNPDLSCIDEILVVANETSGIDFSPSGDGTAYAANTVYAAVNQVVYKGTGTSETVTGLTNGTTYYYEIFTRKGTEWSAGVEVSCTPAEVTVLYPGDLAIVSVNTAYNAAYDDEICFFAFKDITAGTAIDFTDNGYERETDGLWGEGEGTIRLLRTGSTIEKGTVICFHGKGGESNNFTVNVCGTDDDANWTVSSLNGTEPYDLNVNDQIWIMQGGNWNNPSGDHNSTYDGNVLFGWTATGWKTSSGYGSTKGSTLFEDAECFNTNVSANTNEDKVKFFADTSLTLSQSNWIGEINSEWNWTGYSSNGDYNSGGLDYSGSCVKFKIDNSLGNGAGMWQGGEDNNWFNCANWLNMQVPDETIDVTILSNALNEVNVDDTQEDADIYGPAAKCKNLTIQEGGDSVYVQIDDANDELIVSNNLTIEANAQLFNDNSGTLNVEGNLIIENGGLLDIHANPGTGSLVKIKGHWIDNNLVDNDTLGLFETDGTVEFSGSAQQTITDASGKEIFYRLKINNSNGLDMNGHRIDVSGTLDLSVGNIITGNDTLVVLSTSTTAIQNQNSNSYVNGYLRRNVNATGLYQFPVGDASQFELASIELNSSTGLNYFTSSFSTHPGTHQLVDGGGIPLNLEVNGTILTEMLDYGFWTISPDNSAYTVDYDVYLTSRGHNNGGGEPEQHTIVKRENAFTDWAAYEANHDNTTQSGSGSSAITAQLSNLSGFSDFAIARNQQFPLPVSLLNFAAKIVNEGVLLEWATASELNNDIFTIERSGKTMTFQVLTTEEGAGQSNTITRYSYLDKDPINGLSYYKLSQTDFDGTYKDLATATVSINKGLEYTIIDKVLEVKLNEEVYNIEVYNTLGQKVIVVQESVSDKAMVNLSLLERNTVYLIRIYNSNTEEIIKYIK
jgi:hypothetical protein